MLPHEVPSLLEVPAAVTTLPRLRALSGRPGRWGSPGVGKPRLTSAGSAPRGPGRLRAGAGNGSATRARRPRWQLEGPRVLARRPRVTRRSPARPLAHSLTHSPRGAGRRPLPSLSSPLPRLALPSHTHRPSIYLRRESPRAAKPATWARPHLPRL